MKFIFTVSITAIILLSCSQMQKQVNTQSSDYYQTKRKMRHGIIPVTTPKHNLEKPQSKTQIVIPPAKMVVRGKETYLKNCYDCHGLGGKGDGPKSVDLKIKPKNLIKVVKEVPNFKFFMAISQWQGKMPGWINALSNEELDDVKAYLQHLAYSKEKPSF